jgi:hypothetical protein
LLRPRAALKQKGKDWSEFGDYAEQIMSNVDAKQQVNPQAWEEAWWYCWGVAERNKAAAPKAPEAPTPHPRSQDDEDDLEYETRVVTSNANADRSRRGAPSNDSKPRIEDPEERRTYNKFKRHLGLDISEEEWIRLASDEIRTVDDYTRLQEELKAPTKRAR